MPTTSAPAVIGVPAAAREVARGSSGRNEVALTFHGAGDLGLARDILRILTDRGAPATVFVVGSWLAANPEMATAILSSRCELANHTWSHPVLADLPADAIREEIVRCQQILQSAGSVVAGYFRQSSAQNATTEILEIAGAVGYPVCVSYSLDSMDWTDPGETAIRRNVAGSTAGEIVSLHLGHAGTVAALGPILDDLAARGLTPVTVSRLLTA